METSSSSINISFVDENKMPYEAKEVIISDGETRIDLKGITRLSQQVPSKATYTVIWNSGGFDTMEQFPLNLAADSSHSFTFYCLNRSETVQQAKPYVLLEEDAANPKLTWQWDDQSRTLNISLTQTEGKIVDIVTWITANATILPVFSMSNISSASYSWDWSVCFPPNFSYSQSYDNLSSTSRLQFIEVDSSLQVVAIRKATYNRNIIDTFDAEAFQAVLTSLDGKIIDPSYYWPQFGVGNGYFHLKAASLPDDYVILPLPVKVEAGKFSMYELYPPLKAELTSFSFGIAGEYFHTRAIVSSVVNDSDKKTLTAYTSASGDTKYTNGYFGYFTLPVKEAVVSISAFDADGKETKLVENQDYVVTGLDVFLIVSLRVPIDSSSIVLSYQ